MTTNDIEIRVFKLLQAKAGDAHPLTMESTIAEDTGLDSVSIMDFVMDLEDEFEVTIPLDRLADIETVHDLADVIGGLCAESA